MRILKGLLTFVLGLTGILLLTVIVIHWIDTSGTSYLDIDKNEPSLDNSCLITHVNVIPMNADTVLENKMVYIRNGVIEKIADNIAISGVEVFDAQNKYMVPGLIDMHVHIWDKYELGLYLSNGVTAVRNLWGMPMHLRIKEEVMREDILSPMFFTTGPKLTGTEFIGDDNLNVNSPAEAREKVITYKDKGYDFIKTYYGLDKELFDAVIEQAGASEIDIVAHPSQRVPFGYHLNPQIRSIEHVEEIVQQPLAFDLDSGKLQAVVDEISRADHTRYCPTITVFNNIYQMLIDDGILDSDSLAYMNPLIRKVDSENEYKRWFRSKQKDTGVVSSIKSQHDFHITIVRRLHEAGVNIVCGTDAGIGITLPGFSVHRELQFYKEAGLSNYEVLKTATVYASQTHAIMNNMGTIEPGKVANLLITQENPLISLSALERPAFVFIKGRRLNRKTLDSFNEKAKNRRNLLATALRYAENLVVER
ncbi:amidohydrolase family protein [Roseivirga sp. BDSF3-8]|uniref:amidohydrolase family protein n=1 Tax=Roseivirga sp. BDSF3-8 TaxID=3241598 RepID=UPI0035324814